MISARRWWPAAAMLLCLAATAVQAQVQSAEQRKCITAMNDVTAKLAHTQLLVGMKCLQTAAKGKLPPGQSATQCLTADGKGKIAKGIVQLTEKEQLACSGLLPDFGYSGAPILTGAAISAALGSISGLYGDDLDAAVIDAATDKSGAKCQVVAAKGITKLLSAMLAEFRACKKDGLKEGRIASAADLADCLDAIDTDGKGKIAKAIAKLTAAHAAACGATPQATAFPGRCAGAADLGACVTALARCRSCELFRTGDELTRDCDLFDDGLANASCSAACVDADSDMYGDGCGLGADCDDTDPDINPAAAERCNNLDDDCDTLIDDFPSDVGTSCGASNVAPCTFGTYQCNGGMLMCSGNVEARTEICNGVDDDCDGAVDLSGSSPPADSVGTCDARPAAPPGATSACTAGQKACVGGVVRCEGASGPAAGGDGCLLDADCDGALTNQPNTQTDVRHCGGCGHDCTSGAVHARWACAAGSCQFVGCDAGYVDLDANQTCETACQFRSAQEACNGIDDDCDGQVDEDVVAPSTVDVCGVSPAASTQECTTGVTRTCVNGAWQCSFPTGVCNPRCAATAEVCDALDNDCDGLTNENVPGFGEACHSDDGAPSTHGPCRTSGTWVCNTPNSLRCSGQKASCTSLPGGCTEQCDGIDNDCDGSVDEPFTSRGSNATFFVKPAVTRVASNLWIFTYEASRPNATATHPGSGNGYFTGLPLSSRGRTPACSVADKLPWSNVAPAEVIDTCAAAGGTICSVAQWQIAARAKAGSCLWGYSPDGAACTTGALPNPPNSPGKYCNLVSTFDFDTAASGTQEKLLPTNSTRLSQCAADWSATLGNTGAAAALSDITGNLREIVHVAPGQYAALGGSYPTQSENSARADFTAFAASRALYDTGFRCCFTSNPAP